MINENEQPGGRGKVWLVIFSLVLWFLLCWGVEACFAQSPNHPAISGPPPLDPRAIAFIIALIYFLPTILAFKNRVPSRWLIFVVNLVAGWTFIIWIVCLGCALGFQWGGGRNRNKNTNVNHNVTHVHIHHGGLDGLTFPGETRKP